jgi:hypothetical protein
MTRRQVIRSSATIGVAVLMACARVFAATVEVSVVERGAGPVPSQTVVLYRVTPGGQSGALDRMIQRPAGRCTTGPSGRCKVGDLDAGVYYPVLPAIADPNLCAPSDSPMDVYGTVTISKPEASAPLRIELQRGVRIQFRVVSERAAIPRGSRIELGSDNGETTAAVLDAGGRAHITLGSGSWVARLEGPPGGRVERVELDGEALDSLDVPIELMAPSSDRFVTWTLSAPCTVRGTVKSTRIPAQVAVGATLVTPGRWGASPLCRAMPCAGSPSSPVLPPGTYQIELPSGTWRIAPTGPTLLESSPPFIELTCHDGEDVKANFDVRETEAADGSKVVLLVNVIDSDGRPLSRVPVELWPPVGDREAKAPLAIEATGRFFQPAAFTTLTAGSYLLRARSPGYRPAVLAVPDLDPEATSPRRVTIRLDKGATIDALVRDEKDLPVAGVGLEVKRIDDVPENDDPAVRLAKSDPVMVVPPSKDQTGHVVVTGLAAGAYRVTPVVSGAIAIAATASVASGDGLGQKDVVVRLGDHDTQELSVRVLPAASLTGRLLCADGGLFPHQADACVLGVPDAEEDDAFREVCAKPVISPGLIVLSGDRRDVFQVGPLTSGSYRLGLRPRGYAQWTWALGTPDGAHAALVQVNGTDAVDLATVPMFCGPAIELRPTVLSRDPLPDLTLATVVAALTRTSRDGKAERRVVSAERDPDRVVLRELPEGEWTLEVTMSHPYFVPSAPVHLSVPLKLERGALVRASVDVASIGGAIVIETATGVARLSGPDGAVRVESARDGTIAINGVVPGIYHVDLCEDSVCTRVSRRWDEARIIRGQMLVVSGAGVTTSGRSR